MTEAEAEFDNGVGSTNEFLGHLLGLVLKTQISVWVIFLSKSMRRKGRAVYKLPEFEVR